MKFVFFVLESYPLPIAAHLIVEGYEVYVGMLQSSNRLMIPENKNKESNEDKKKRLSIYDGLIKKQTADEVLKFLWNVPKNERDDYFIFLDHSNMYNISEQILKMGFKNGLLPTKWYYQMEKKRALAKDFVKKNYKDIKVADSHDFKNIQDGIKFINESEEKIYVLKSNGGSAGTIVPRTDDVENGKKLITDALIKNKKGYEAGGFLLEEKIPNCLEVTPVMVFYNGKLIYSLVEFECKNLGAGDIGLQKGGNLALSVKTDFDCKLNDMAFPKAVYELAKKQPGLSIYDIGLLYNGENFYFTEYCAMRYGWDGIFSEIVMSDEGKPFVGRYFEDIVNGKNPIRNTYGASVRLFNLGGESNYGLTPLDDIQIEWDDSISNNLFLYRIKKKNKELVSVGIGDFLGVATGASDVLETAVGKAYDVVSKVQFENLYYRPKFDFLSMDYKSSILNRLAAIRPFLEREKNED